MCRDLDGHQVGVVGAGDGDEAVGVGDPSLLEDVTVGDAPDDRLAVERGPEPVEGARVVVDDDHVVVAIGRQPLSDHGADEAAAPDDDQHAVPP